MIYIFWGLSHDEWIEFDPKATELTVDDMDRNNSNLGGSGLTSSSLMFDYNNQEFKEVQTESAMSDSPMN